MHCHRALWTLAVAGVVACGGQKPPVTEEPPVDEEDIDLDAESEVVDAQPEFETKKLDVKPDTADAGAEVKAEIDTGTADVLDVDVPEALDIEDLPDTTDEDAATDADAEVAPEIDVPAEIDVPPEVDTAKPPPPDQACTADKDCANLQLDQCLAKYKCVANSKGEKKCIGFFKSDGAKCDDGDACTDADHCAQGECIGIEKQCPDGDGNTCTVEVCNPKVGGCETIGSKKLPTGTSCDDGNPCTGPDKCEFDKCQSGSNKCECTKNDDCQKPGIDDGNKCNGVLTCVLNKCVLDKASVVKCGAGQDTGCQKNTCIPATGKCELKTSVTGTACDDGNSCSFPDLCQGGTCLGALVECDDGNLCTNDTCDKAGGGCKYEPNTLKCDDGDGCTQNDQCAAGACKGAPDAVTCPCKTGADCPDDQNPCNGVFSCEANQCVTKPGSAISCPAATNPCVENKCNPASPKADKCEAKLKTTGTPCDDDNACTVADSCDAGTCKAGAKLVCNDGNPCTDDFCVEALGCIVKHNGAPCDDGDFCTKGDKCASGKCQAGANQCECAKNEDCKIKDFGTDKCLGITTFQCDEAAQLCEGATFKPVTCAESTDPCKWNACEPATGKCVAKSKDDGLQCDDGNACTTYDACKGGVCKGADADATGQCNDKNGCTLDKCVPKTGCAHDKDALVGIACNDGSLCTKDDVCVAGGVCKGADIKPDCKKEFESDCQLADCDPKIGCTVNPFVVGAPCNDKNPCTGSAGAPDICNGAGKCTAGKTKVCNDNAACTTDTCDPGLGDDGAPNAGCVFLANDATCNDGDACTTDTKCLNKLCGAGGSKPVDCDDKNPCTEDACDATQGCLYKPNQKLCDDGSACTSDDVCGGDGKCGGTAVVCDDENVCTKNSCDPAKGCAYTPQAADCGPFANCGGPDPKKPSCVFSGVHLLVTEVYRGKPGVYDDDFVELHNPTTATVDLSDFELQLRPLAKDVTPVWDAIALGSKGEFILPKGYLLVGQKGPLPGGAQPDVVSPLLKLHDAAMVVRVRDKTFQLVHDAVAWDTGFGSEVLDTPDTPQTAKVGTVLNSAAWSSPNSYERKAGEKSSYLSMAPHKPEWLMGNGVDTDDNDSDFVLRDAPEPQTRKDGYKEPACGGTCGGGKVCNYGLQGALEKCVDDQFCASYGPDKALACGAGKACNPGIGECVPDTKGLLLSQVYTGYEGQESAFVEHYNSALVPMDLSGYWLQVKAPTALASDVWQSVLQFPAGVQVPKNRYLTVASKAWASANGGIDFVAPQLPIFGKHEGAAVRLWDPRTQVEIDLVGWGKAKTFSSIGATVGGPAPVLKPGEALERKANDKSTNATMDVGGVDQLKGNGYDTNLDVKDWIVMPAPHPTSLGSGSYEPACGGTCKDGFLCNFTPGVESCVDQFCGGVCTDAGEGCNVATPGVAKEKCTGRVLIAEVATGGACPFKAFDANKPGSISDQPPAANEYILLYNPTPQTVGLEGLVLYYVPSLQSTQQKLTGTGLGESYKLLKGDIAPYSYFLIVPRVYDATFDGALKPDFITSNQWDLAFEQGTIRITRIKDEYQYPKPTSKYADRLGWGIGMESEGALPAPVQQAAPKNASKPECSGVLGAMRRLPKVPAGMPVPAVADLENPMLGSMYAGHGQDTQYNGKDFVAFPTRSLLNSKSPALKP
jgi:hypothetical protein